MQQISLLPKYTKPICKGVFDMYMSYGWGSTGENVTSERYMT